MMVGLTLTCRGVSKHFGGVLAVDDVSMEFVPGRVTGVMGANGAGKSTLIDLLTGVQAADKGQVWLDSQDITTHSSSRRLREGIGRTFQGMKLFTGMTAEENVIACLPPLRRITLVAAFFQSRRRIVTTLRNDAHQVLEKVGGEPLAMSAVDDLSYGDQKLVAIARTIAADVKVLLFDEPFAGLDIDGVNRLSSIIRGLATEGRTVGIIDHNVDAMVQLVDYVYMMDFGRVIASGSPPEVMRDPVVRAAYLGRE